MKVKGMFLLALLVAVMSCRAEVIIPPQPANQLAVDVGLVVEYDGKNDSYTYNYTLTNGMGSAQEIAFFAIAVNPDKGSVTESSSPDGWFFSPHQNENYVSWYAGDGIPDDYVDDGGRPPSIFQIKPGETLSGFSITSTNSPAETNYYVQGYTPIPKVSGDVEELWEEGYEVKHFKDDSVTGRTQGPLGGVLPVYWGNRRPDVDGFVGLVNFDPDNNVFSRPIKFHIRFARDDESIDKSSFTAILNNQDITSQFIFDDSGIGDLVIELNEYDGASVLGKNVLVLSIEGISPKNNKNAKDTDRIIFELL